MPQSELLSQHLYEDTKEKHERSESGKQISGP
jgi:hypothetical protein